MRLERLVEFLGANPVADVTTSTCAAYTRWRTHEGAPGASNLERRPRAVAPSSARRELADLQSALSYAFKSRKITASIPVALPDAAPPRERWLTRSKAARLLAGCLGWLLVPASDLRTRAVTWRAWRRLPDQINRHAARFVVIGLRTGTRHEAILGLGWRQHLHGGFIDLEAGLLYRRAPGAAETKKRNPPIPMQLRLVQHMRRWRAVDGRLALYVKAWNGQRIAKLRRSFASAVALAGLDTDVTPHTLRHTAVTWAVRDGISLWDAAGYYGMTVEMIQRVYGHHASESMLRVARAMQ